MRVTQREAAKPKPMPRRQPSPLWLIARGTLQTRRGCLVWSQSVTGGLHVRTRPTLEIRYPTGQIYPPSRDSGFKGLALVIKRWIQPVAVTEACRHYGRCLCVVSATS
ncbi:hypothetical protein AUP68_03099 [Ilyonectria robusta]